MNASIKVAQLYVKASQGNVTDVTVKFGTRSYETVNVVVPFSPLASRSVGPDSWQRAVIPEPPSSAGCSAVAAIGWLHLLLQIYAATLLILPFFSPVRPNQI